MLSCFHFGYQNLKEDESYASQILVLDRQDSSTEAPSLPPRRTTLIQPPIPPPPISTSLPTSSKNTAARTFCKPDSNPSSSSVASSKPSSSGSSGRLLGPFSVITFRSRGTENLDRQEARRKAAVSAGPVLCERYIRIPNCPAVRSSETEPRTISSNTNNNSNSDKRTQVGYSSSNLEVSSEKALLPSHRTSLTIMPRSKTPWSSQLSGGSGGDSSSEARSTSSGSMMDSASCRAAISAEWTKNGSFINKPPRGWLYPDHQIADGGVCYGLRYIGCLEINTSMKSLDFDTRSQIAKECINRVCEAGGLKTVDKKRKVDKRVSRTIADKPNMDFAGSNVNLTVTSSCLTLSIMETGEIITNHEMPNISFASGGDADTLDFVAYVAKDHRYGRACFVLECGGGLAEDVLTTIGQAFELRFKEFLKRAPRIIGVPERLESPVLNGVEHPTWGEDPDYYNDLPGKIPPEAAPPVPPLPDYHTSVNGETSNGIGHVSVTKEPSVSSLPVSTCNQPPRHAVPTSKNNTCNLLDFPGVSVPAANARSKPEPEYVNSSVCSALGQGDLSSSLHSATSNPAIPPRESSMASKDPFDMQPFDSSLPSPPSTLPPPPPRHADRSMSTNSSHHHGASTSAAASSVGAVGGKLLLSSMGSAKSSGIAAAMSHKSALAQEDWFHGPISRKESEALVVKDGDFLVRESQGSPGQYVLTGMQGGVRKHLLLVDPEGVVRTKDKTFESVSHLINYHRNNGLPIISAESALLLRNPVMRLRPPVVR